MARFDAAVPVAAGALLTWRLVTDWASHGRWIPLTSMRVETPGPAGVGCRFSGRTGLGPLAFEDPMEVVRFDPPASEDAGAEPGRCEVVKQGRVVIGRAGFEVRPLGPGHSVLAAFEDVDLPPVRLTRHGHRLVRALGAPALRRVLAAMAADAAVASPR